MGLKACLCCFFKPKPPKVTPLNQELYQLIQYNSHLMLELLSLFSSLDEGARIQIKKSELLTHLKIISGSIAKVALYLEQDADNQLPYGVEDKHDKLKYFCSELYRLIKTMPPGYRLLPWLINLHVSYYDDYITIGVYSEKECDSQIIELPVETVEKEERFVVDNCCPKSEPSCDFVLLTARQYNLKLQIMDCLTADLIVQDPTMIKQQGMVLW